MKIPYMSKICLIGLLLIFYTQQISAQISGTVFADYDASGIRTTASPSEPLMSGVIVTAYNAAGTILASYTTTQGTATSATYPYTAPNFSIPVSGTAYNGTLGSNTGFVPASTAVRLEFTLSATGCTADNSVYSGQGSSSVQFITAPSSTVTYGINNPADYNTGTTGVSLFVPCYVSGDPLGGGTTGTSDWFVGFPYTNSGNTTTPAQHVSGTVIGSTWGVAYSKQAKKLFTSALLKRQSGLGTLGIGGIYLLEPTASSFTVTPFFNMDNNTFNTAANPVTRVSAAGLAGAPVYGNGSSFSLPSASLATYLGSNDPLTGKPAGWGVVGTNANRGLSANFDVPSNDPATMNQAGKVGIGDIDISDDGKYLFVMNLYLRKVFRLELNDAYNPTSVVAITSYDLPSITVTNGELRPWATKFYKGKLYIGAVASGEYETNATANANLRAYVFELSNATSSAVFNTTPILNFPLNYVKGLPYAGGVGTARGWYPWQSDVNNFNTIPGFSQSITHPTPLLSDIEFSDRGDMILDFSDRTGLQLFPANYGLLSGGPIYGFYNGGDILMAGKDCNSSTGYVIENNGAFNSAGINYSSGAANNQGPGNSEFFKGDNQPFSIYHEEISMGAAAILPGSQEVVLTLLGPFELNSGGTGKFSTTTGLQSATGYTLYKNFTTGTAVKGIGLGDLELLLPLAPLEIGNRVWLDTNKDGVQDAGENGIGNVTIELYADFDNNGTPDGAALATTTTSTTAGNTLGTWYFNNTNVTDGDPSVAGNQAGPQPNKRYLVRIGASTWTAGTGTGALANLFLTTANTGAASQPDLTDNDASLSASIPTISYLTGSEGQNDHTLDFGFIACPTITNPSIAQTLCAGTSGSNITVNSDYNAPNGIRFVKFTSDQMASSSPTTTEATNIYAGTAIATVTPTGASSPYTATYTWNSTDFPNATTAPITYYVYAILNPDLGANCRPVQEIQITVNPRPSTPSVSSPIYNICPLTSVDLTTISAALTPSVSGGVFEWHVSNSSGSALVSNQNTVGAGDYYLFERSPAACYSIGLKVTVAIQVCCPTPTCIPVTITRFN